MARNIRYSLLHIILVCGIRLHLGSPRLVPRVLEVTKGSFCIIIGTVYMDMPLKPNVLEDIGRDVRPCPSLVDLHP